MAAPQRGWLSLVVVVAFAIAVSRASGESHALDLSVADIERALTIARGVPAERAAFHAPYIMQLKNAFVPALEIITEFRRVVRVAEDHILRGDRMFAFSARLAQDAVSPWNDRVSVLA